jgi:hypothetical protein
MDRRSARRVFLGVQWGAGSWDDAALWCDVLLGKTGDAPVCWNLPCPPAARRGRPGGAVLATVAGRLAGGRDTLCAMGFSGACQPLLSLDELDRELSWCRRNPWGTGLAELMGTPPRVLLPRLPDLRRPAALQACARNGFSRLGVGLDCGFRTWNAGSGVQAFSSWRLAAAGFEPGRRPPLPRGDLFLVLDLDGLASPQALEVLLDAVVAPLLPFAAPFPAADSPAPGADAKVPAADPPQPASCPDLAWTLFPSPVARQRLLLAAPLSRKRRKKAEEYQRLLAILSPGGVEGLPADGSTEAEEPRVRLPVAHMLGEVTLAGSGFDVKLSGGRLLGLTRGSAPLVPLRRAVSSLRVAGRTHAYRTRGSFSFETQTGTGLREELSAEGPGDQRSALSVEYSFEDSSPLLCIRAEAAWPRLGPAEIIEECVPLSFVVREVRGASAAVLAEAPDGSTAEFTVREGEGWVAVPGVRQVVRLEGGDRLVLSWADADARRWGLPFFRVSRCLGRRRGLEVNPFGTTPGTAGSLLGGRSESFRLLLGVEKGE